jgi:hypothetical protein
MAPLDEEFERRWHICLACGRCAVSRLYLARMRASDKQTGAVHNTPGTGRSRRETGAQPVQGLCKSTPVTLKSFTLRVTTVSS